MALKMVMVLSLFASVQVRAQEPKASIRFPMQSGAAPVAVTKLNAATFYVIDSDVPCIVTSSPLGLVTVNEEAGPIKVRGVFVDGNGKAETRTYLGKSVFFIEAAATGKCEILVIPATAKSAADILRKTIDVDAGPIPPGPKPNPKPDPKPPVPPTKIAAHVTFVGPEKTPVSLATNNDVALRAWLAAASIKVHVFKDGDPGIAMSGLDVAMKLVGGSPAIIVQDAIGNVLTYQRMTTDESVKLLVEPYIKK